jgi:hypothetical protein
MTISRRNITIIVLVLTCFSSAYCQTFKGTVYDRATDSTLSFAVIYISGTSMGTYSDKHGNFELVLSGNRSEPITISMVGYYSISLTEHSANKVYKIYLSTKINELNEVIVKGKKGKWDTYLKIFKRQFLGESVNASMCNIINEKDLRFFNITDTSESVYSLNPLLIHNRALGYTITYYLDKFIYTCQKDETHIFNEKCLILGNYLFKDNLLKLNESGKRAVEKRRRSAYLGSRMHFFRLLYSGNLHSKGRSVSSLSDSLTSRAIFLIYTNSNSRLSVMKKDNHSGFFKYNGDFFVKYREMGSRINVKKDSVYFEKYGYYDPFGVDFSGYMSDRRIGDLLPFEYFLK